MTMTSYYAETSIAGIFRNRVLHNGDQTFLRYWEGEELRDISWNEVQRRADAISSWLIATGVNPGENLAIFSENRPEWVFADQAVLAVGCADVTVYATSSASEAAYVIGDSGSRYCFCSGAEQVQKVLSEREKMPSLEKVIVFDRLETSLPDVISLDEVMDLGEADPRAEEIDRLVRAIDPYAVMTIMYTSGTTGEPKGVMLSHANMVAETLSFVRHQPHPKGEVALSVLPLSHALERSTIYNLVTYIEGVIVFSRGIRFLLDDLREVRPTVMLCVPRIPEKIYEEIQRQAEEASWSRRWVFDWAMRIGSEAVPYLAANQELPRRLKRRYPLAYRLVFRKIRRGLGLDRITCAGVGGSSLSEEVHEFFVAMQVFWLTGYGLTETAPVTHSHRFLRDGPLKVGTTGVALPLVQCRAAEDGEILVKGPQVMMGYYRRPEDTAVAFTEDGWFKTGDIGEIDEDGYLTITDRKKDLIVTAGGKNIAPQPIEALMTRDHFIDQVVLVGDKRKYVSALIVPAFDSLREYASGLGISWSSVEELVNLPEIQEFYRKRVEQLCEPLSRYQKVKKFRLLPGGLSHEEGHLTPTMKIKRKKVEQEFHEVIDSMYEDPGKKE